MFYLELYVSLINYFYLKLFYNAPRVNRKKNGEGCLNYFLIGNIPKASAPPLKMKGQRRRYQVINRARRALRRPSNN